MWCSVCEHINVCENANSNNCAMCSRNILYKDYFKKKSPTMEEIHNSLIKNAQRILKDAQ